MNTAIIWDGSGMATVADRREVRFNAAQTLVLNALVTVGRRVRWAGRSNAVHQIEFDGWIYDLMESGRLFSRGERAE